MNRANGIIRCMLCGVLVLTGIFKVGMPSADSVLGLVGSRVFGGVELLLALWVALRSKERVALWAVVLIAGGGVATTWLSPNRAGCGCLGTLVRMSESQHLMLASGLGLLASLGLATSQDLSIRQQ
tara:strand:- start:802 stop:1179 length:378 start_codon:yes stop_codon:yes gene_type:complete